jgi:hypothetical protein
MGERCSEAEDAEECPRVFYPDGESVDGRLLSVLGELGNGQFTVAGVSLCGWHFYGWRCQA